MKNYYDENYKAFVNKHANYEKMFEDADECEVLLYEDLKGDVVFGIRNEGYDRLIGSGYDNQHFIDTWVAEASVESDSAVIFVYGLGDYRCIEALSKRLPQNEIVVYEPRIEYLKSIMEVCDISAIIKNEKIEILAGEFGIKFMTNLCNDKVDMGNSKYSIYRIMPQYEILYPNPLEEWRKVIEENLKIIFADKKFIMDLGKSIEKNVLVNIYKAILSNNIREVIDNIKVKKNNTAVLVSAGPSLSKNIRYLKEVKNKAFIMVVDTAVKPVLNEGIRPDMIITVDPNKREELFIYNGKLVDVPMVTKLNGNNKIINNYVGKLFFSYDFDLLFERLYEGVAYNNIFLNTGGSVANNAFSFLVECGFDNIILIGQDLAYLDNKTHVGGAFDDEKSILVKGDKKYLTVKGIDGDELITGLDMNHYREWFERVIKMNSRFNVIDATEGGARIEGTTLMTFEAAIKEYIEELPEVDYEKIIESVELPSEAIIQARLEKVYCFDEEILETKKDIKHALQLYDELDALNRKGNYSSNRFSTLTKQIGEEMQKIREGVLGAFVMYAIGEDDYDIIENINENKQNLYEEFKMIIDSGRKTLNKYYDNADDIYEKMKSMIADVKSKEEKRKSKIEAQG